jgi:hypothetical protein
MGFKAFFLRRVGRGLVSSVPNFSQRFSEFKLAHRRTIVEHYPFLLFCSAVVIPTAYWIAIIEIGISNENDQTSPLTFNQVGPVGILFFSSFGS